MYVDTLFVYVVKLNLMQNEFICVSFIAVSVFGSDKYSSFSNEIT